VAIACWTTGVARKLSGEAAENYRNHQLLEVESLCLD